MTPERWQQVKAIFDGAVECSSASRMAYIRERCGNDEELRREVESLLASDAPTGSFLDNRFLVTNVSTSTSSETSQDPSHLVGDSFGPYVPVRVLGEGGMGIVYLAHQQQPIRREVALKVVKFGMDSREVLGRFEIERQTLALMDHPNVARVIDAGTSARGRSYFVMEYVEGVPITQYCDEKALTTRERLQLFIPVCHALQHAHQKGIIHRDVKPSNVLVAEIDGTPFPKVIDFGVARATEQCSVEREAFTLSGQLIGTPEYMSPEQASLNSQDIDTATDVYSLGVLLYELLVGVLPLDIKTMRKMALGEVLRAIRETPAPKPTAKITEMGADAEKLALQRSTNLARLKRELAGDLDSIIMKAIEKDRRCRYASASEFANDIERSLRSEPVMAHPPDLRYRAGRFVRRHLWTVLLASSATLVLVCGIVFTTWQAAVAREERARADERTRQLYRTAVSMLEEIDEQVKRVLENPQGPDVNTKLVGLRNLLIQRALGVFNSLAQPREQPYGFSRYISRSYFSSYSAITSRLPSAWFSSGYSPQLYEMGVDRSVFHSGKASGFIAAKAMAQSGDWATLLQRIKADAYRGRRIRLSSFIKTDSVGEGAHFWLRVDALGGIRAFDAMEKSPIRGTTDWRRYELVLDVPDDSISISYGLLLMGPVGKAWLDDLKLDVVTGQAPITGLSENALREQSRPGTWITIPNSPANPGFENGYQTNGSARADCAVGSLSSCGGQWGSDK